MIKFGVNDDSVDGESIAGDEERLGDTVQRQFKLNLIVPFFRDEAALILLVL